MGIPIKPTPWQINSTLVDPEWGWWWHMILSSTADPPVIAPLWGEKPGPGFFVHEIGKKRDFGDISIAPTPTWVTTPFGPGLDFPGGGNNRNNIKWNRSSIANSPITMAVVVHFDGTTNDHTVASNQTDKSTANKGILITARGPEADFRITLSAVADGTSITGIFNTKDWFFFAGTYDQVNMECYVRNLMTGEEGFVSDAQTSAGVAADGQPGFGRWKRNITTANLNGQLAMGVIASVKLTENELRRWGSDPFGPFRPQRHVAGLASVVAAVPSLVPLPWSFRNTSLRM